MHYLKRNKQYINNNNNSLDSKGHSSDMVATENRQHLTITYFSQRQTSFP